MLALKLAPSILSPSLAPLQRLHPPPLQPAQTFALMTNCFPYSTGKPLAYFFFPRRSYGFIFVPGVGLFTLSSPPFPAYPMHDSFASRQAGGRRWIIMFILPAALDLLSSFGFKRPRDRMFFRGPHDFPAFGRTAGVCSSMYNIFPAYDAATRIFPHSHLLPTTMANFFSPPLKSMPPLSAPVALHSSPLIRKRVLRRDPLIRMKPRLRHGSFI